MAKNVFTDYQGSPALGSSIFVKILDPTTGSVLVARHNTGIREDAAGYYVWYGSLADLDAYEAIWDEGAGTVPSGILVVPQPSITITGGGGGGGVPIVLPAGGVSPVVTQTFFIKRGDNEALIFPVTELDATGKPQIRDVTGWTGNFKLRAAPDSATVLINQPFYISDINGDVSTDGTLGLIAYNWGRTASPARTSETDRLGSFVAEFETHRPSGIKKTYPTTSDTNRQYITVVFVADLDDAGSH